MSGGTPLPSDWHGSIAWLKSALQCPTDALGGVASTLLEALASSLEQAAGTSTFALSIERELLLQSSVVFSTLSTAGRDDLVSPPDGQNRVAAPILVVDEAAQTSEPEVLIAIRAVRPQRAILVGDPQQLPSTILSPVAKQCGFDRSIMERLVESGVSCHLLNTQYRMHATIAAFPNARYYHGKLLNGSVAPPAEGDSPHPLVFYDVSDGWEQRKNLSFVNDREIEVVAGLIQRHVQQHGQPRESIAIMTFYKAQASALSARLLDLNLGPPVTRVATVDGFQGSEADMCIVSFVRTTGIGFLSDFRRLNVALTRARKSLVLIGHAAVNPHLLVQSLAVLLIFLTRTGTLKR